MTQPSRQSTIKMVGTSTAIHGKSSPRSSLAVQLTPTEASLQPMPLRARTWTMYSAPGSRLTFRSWRAYM